jgi:DNA-directed RNA polymerase sigma subunit (sigma70/sigma32)
MAKKKIKKNETPDYTNQYLTVLKMWKTSDARDIARELGVKPDRVRQIAHIMRKNGIDLPRKRGLQPRWNQIKQSARRHL